MSIEKALYGYMSGHASIIAQVGTRVYPEVAPEDTIYPFITFNVTSEAHDHSMDGATGMANPRIQIDVWAEKISDRVITAEAIRTSMDGFRGDMGDDDLNIRSCFLQDKTNFQEPTGEGKGKPVYRSSIDFSIWHVESVPTL